MMLKLCSTQRKC